MALYGVNNLSNAAPAQTSLATTFKSVLALVAQTANLRRGYIYEFDVGADGVPNATDNAIVWDIARFTVSGTGVAMTINPLDPTDAAIVSHISKANHTIEPTIGSGVSSLWMDAFNQRASYRWVVNPGGPGELVTTSTNDNGLVIRAKSTTYASTVTASLLFRD